MHNEPSHRVITFVFSDIEHSTQLAQVLRENYPQVLSKYRNAIRKMLLEYKGREIDTAGDGFFMIFNKPEDAILAIGKIQMLFYSEPWATEIELKVRMGIHTGKALSTESGYTGVEVHTASRICDAAHGGQVLVSEASYHAIDSDIMKRVSLSPLGDYILKDFVKPTKLYQLLLPGIKAQFPKPRTQEEEKKIAVLPFRNLSKKEDYNYVGEGIAEEMITALGKVQGLRVASRSVSFALIDHNLNPIQIGQKLKVDSVLEGRIKFHNDEFQVSIELVDAQTGLNIWSEKYKVARDNFVDLQDEVIRKTAEALECKLMPAQYDSVRQRQSRIAEAYDYYLRGRRFYAQFSTRGIELAIQMFQKAIEADNNYALAYAGIADCYAYQYQHKLRSKNILNEAEAASKKAILLAPELAEVYVSLGIVMSQRGDFEEAEKSFEIAISRDPTLFLGWFHYGRACFTHGILDKAARLFQQANRVEPNDYQSILLSAQIYDDIGSFDFAQILRQRGVEIAESWLELNPGDTRALYFAANALAFLNQREKSLHLLGLALSLEPDDSMALYNAACVYALLKMKKEALTNLERSYHAGLTLRGWYENDSNLDSIRDEERFIALLKKMEND